MPYSQVDLIEGTIEANIWQLWGIETVSNSASNHFNVQNSQTDELLVVCKKEIILVHPGLIYIATCGKGDKVIGILLQLILSY